MATPAPAPAHPHGADPFPVGLQKYAAASGIIFAVALLVTIILSGATTPEQSAPASEWTKFAEDNEGKSRLAALVFIFAAYNMLWFGGYLRSVLALAESSVRGFARISNVALIGAAVGAAGMAFGIGLGAIALQFEDANPEIIRGTHSLSGAGFYVASFGFAAMLFAAGIVNEKTSVFPKWLSYVAFLGGAAFLLQNLTLLSEEYDNFAGIFYPLSFLALFVFCIGASVTFIRTVGRPVQGSV